MSDPVVIRLTAPSDPAIVRVYVPTAPYVIKVKIPGEQGPEGDASTVPGPQGETGPTGATGPQGLPGDAPAILTVTSGNVTVDADDDELIVINKTVGAATTVTLPLSADRTNRKQVTIKDGKGDCDVNNITVSCSGSDTIDGLSSVTLNFAFQSMTIYPYPDGSGWFIA